MKRVFALIAAVVVNLFCVYSMADETDLTQKVMLSGNDANTKVEWDFFCTGGRRSGQWTKIAVPSCWETKGFGQFTYGHVKAEDRLNERGLYRHSFYVPVKWKNKEVRIVFEAVATDATVRINGKNVGTKHQGAYYRFSYDISKFLKYGSDNILEVDVDKASADRSVYHAEEDADYWVYGGIFRPVWLEIKPKDNIERIAIDAGADGHFRADIFLSGQTDDLILKGQIFTCDGNPFGTPFTAVCANGKASLDTKFKDVALWNSETPNLYKVRVMLEKNGRAIHSVEEKFGFRTVEIRAEDGVYVNGTKIVFKGVDRHSHWPTSGRTLSDEINLQDVLAIKEMNMNAVRMSHYPPDPYFLDLCDSLGLYVLDELTSWHAYYDTVIGRKLVKELVIRDVNHPSILFWDNGNENGFNLGLVDEFSVWDPQKREVIHPWKTEDLTSTHHYGDWWWVDTYLSQNRKVFFPTESMHGLYDGGHGAGLEDYWTRITAAPNGAGCFLWDLVDAGLDRNGTLDTDGDHGADGILGPYREKEASFFTIKDIWSPVQLGGGDWLPATFDGKISVDNGYSFTNLNECNFKASLHKFDFLGGKEVVSDIALESPNVEPGARGFLHIPIPSDFASWNSMSISAYGPDGKEIYTWTKTITKAENYASAILEEDVNDSEPVIENEKLVALKTDADTLPLGNCRFTISDEVKNGSRIMISSQPGGWTQISYVFKESGRYDNIGVTFDFPEDKIRGIRWLGRGPYRVWKNRLRGVEFGLWEKSYNDSRTGETWEYPEFKGYHRDMYVADIETDYGILRVVFATDDLFLHLLTPKCSNRNASGNFPDGQISILNAISPVGTKFTSAQQSGPHGMKNLSIQSNFNLTPGTDVITGCFYLKFIPK